MLSIWLTFDETPGAAHPARGEGARPSLIPWEKTIPAQITVPRKMLVIHRRKKVYFGLLIIEDDDLTIVVGIT